MPAGSHSPGNGLPRLANVSILPSLSIHMPVLNLIVHSFPKSCQILLCLRDVICPTFHLYDIQALKGGWGGGLSCSLTI